METQLGRRGHGDDDKGRTEDAPASSSAEATRLGGRRGAEIAPPVTGGPARTEPGRRADRLPAAGDVVRFGPGVPAAPAWPAAAGPPAKRRRRAAGGLAGAVATAALVALVAWLLLWRPEPLVAVGAAVAANDPGTACDVTVDVVGTIDTNGRAGTLSYQWLRSDGETSAVLSQSVESGTTVVEVHLMWTLAGTGTYPATATLRVLEPSPAEASGSFTYRCR